MIGDSFRLDDGFSERNLAFIYRGEPAMSGYRLPVNVLSARHTEAVSYLLEGLSYREIGDAIGITAGAVGSRLNESYSLLGVVARHQLAGFFPRPGDEEVRATTLAGLEGQRSLADLQSFSEGKPYESGVSPAVMKSDLLATRLANAVRALYVGVIDAHPGEFGTRDIAELTLPNLVELEPEIRGIEGLISPAS